MGIKPKVEPSYPLHSFTWLTQSQYHPTATQLCLAFLEIKTTRNQARGWRGNNVIPTYVHTIHTFKKPSLCLPAFLVSIQLDITS